MSDLLYSKTHEWVSIEGEEATVGISQFAQESLGDITYVELPNIDDSVELDSECGSIESVKAASDLNSPITGVVTALNTELENAPEVINQDPYGAGWLFKVKVTAAPEGLMDAEAYAEFCKNEAH